MFVARHHSYSKAPAIEGTLEAAIANVRSDDAKNDWVLCGFIGGENIKLIGTGIGGIETLKTKIVEWDVCYGLVRCTHTLEQAGYVQTDFIKFVWIYWRPDNIPVIRKMTIGVNEGEMKQLFAPYHAELQACSLEELGPGPLADVLDTVTMRADKTSANTERTSSSQTLLEKGRAAWTLARSSLPAIHFAHFAIADEQKKVTDNKELMFKGQDEFAKAIKDIRSDISPADWCLVGYEDFNVLRMISAGEGGLDALLDATDPFGVNYGVLRVSEKLDLVFHEAYCFITWMPENVPAFVKARVSIHQGAVAAAFRKHVHCQFFFRGSEREDITLNIIRARVRQIIGKDAADDARRKKKSTMKTGKVTQASRRKPAPSTRPKYIAAKTKNNSLRGSIVIKADTLRMAGSPSAEEKEHFPKMFLDLTLNRDAATIPSSESAGFLPVGSVDSESTESGAITETVLAEDDQGAEELEDEAFTAMKIGDSEERNKGESEAVLTTVWDAVEKVRQGSFGADYLVVEWRKQGKAGKVPQEQVEIKEIGSGGVEALADCLEAQSVIYGLVRVKETKVTTKNNSFCSVKWATEDTPVADEAKAGTLQGDVARLFQPFNERLNADHQSGTTTSESAPSLVRWRKQ